MVSNIKMSHVMKDNGKYPLVICKVLLSFLVLWPVKRTFSIRFAANFILMNVVILQIFHTYFMLDNITNLQAMSRACTTVSTTLQTASKSFVLIYYSKDLASIIDTIFTKFWRADLVNEVTNKSIHRGSQLIVCFWVTFISCAFFSAWDFMAVPLISGERFLPLESYFPFNWQKSPVFELLYIWQFFLSLYTVINTIATFDFFFNSLVMNCVSQFKLLDAVLSTVGTNKAKIINEKIQQPDESVDDNLKDDIDFLLVGKCIRHHNLVLDICEKLQRIFGYIILQQFFISASALCMSSLVLTQFDVLPSEMVSFSAAHLVQFFFLCTVGSELIWRSGSVAVGAYCSFWYNLHSKRVRNSIGLIILRSQREQAITAMGFANLDYISFVDVLRFTFSFYTLLSSLEL